MRTQRRNRSGFTLMEVLLVMAILVVMASLVTFAYLTIQKNTSQDAAFNQAADANQIQVRNSNTQAYGNLVLACMDNISFEIIDGLTTDELQSRNAALAFVYSEITRNQTQDLL